MAVRRAPGDLYGTTASYQPDAGPGGGDGYDGGDGVPAAEPAPNAPGGQRFRPVPEPSHREAPAPSVRRERQPPQTAPTARPGTRHGLQQTAPQFPHPHRTSPTSPCAIASRLNGSHPPALTRERGTPLRTGTELTGSLERGGAPPSRGPLGDCERLQNSTRGAWPRRRTCASLR